MAAAMEHTVGPAPVLGRHVEDELQAEGRVTATEDPAAAGLPGAEVVAAMASGVVGLATPGRRVPTGEGTEPSVVGTPVKNTGPEAEAPTCGSSGAIARVHAAPVARPVHDGVAHVARPGGRPARPLEPAPPGRVPVDGEVMAALPKVGPVIGPEPTTARAPRSACPLRPTPDATVP